MPARSNPFQKLILRIHQQLAPVGINVTVEESGFTEEPSSGAPRETDVKIIMQTPSGTEHVAVECRDHARAQEVAWIDSLIGKYIDLGFDKVIAVSSSGFSSTALAKAQKFKIECRSLEEVLGVDWPAEFIKLGVVTVEHQLVDLQFGIKCDPPLTERDELNDVVIASDGSEHAGYSAMMKWMEIQARDHFLSKRAETFRVLADYDNRYRIEIERGPNNAFVVHEGTRHSILRLTLACTVVTTRTKHTVKHQRYSGAMVTTVEGVLGRDLTLVQGTQGLPTAFKGTELEKVDMTLFDSANEEDLRKD
jgi:hypothetical protein